MSVFGASFAFFVFSVFSFLAFLWAPGGSRPLRRSLALVVPSCRFASLPVALHSFSGLWRFVCSLRSLLALHPLSCAQDVRFPLAAARGFARFCRSNLQRSCALRFDSERAFLSLSGAVDYISSLHLTFQSAHFLMACVCSVSNPGIYRSRAPPSLYFLGNLLGFQPEERS